MKKMSILIVIILSFSFNSTFVLALASKANTLEEFSLHDKIRNVKISPSGKYLGVSRYFEGESQLLIVDTLTMKAVNNIEFKGAEEVGNFYWANDERIIIKILSRKSNQEGLVYYGELMSMDVNSRKGKMIFGTRFLRKRPRHPKEKLILEKHKAMAASWAEIIDLLPNDNEHILISAKPYSKKQNKKARIYKLNIYDANIKFVTESPITNARFLTDKNGELILATASNNKDEKVAYEYLKDDSSWQELNRFSFGTAFVPLIYEKKSRNLIVLDNFNIDKRALFEINLETGDRKLLFQHSEYDISWVNINTRNKLVQGITLHADYPEYHYPIGNIKEQENFKELTKIFSGYLISVTGNINDGNLSIVYVRSDIESGAWYLFDRNSKTVSFIGKRNANLNSEVLSPKQAFEFNARDGIKIPAYLTLPKNNKQQKYPTILLVHDIPDSYRDEWIYDKKVQILALFGYAVIQINYRGSYGYGKKYTEMGYKHWGDLIQRDLIDGLDYLIEQGFIDSKRVCVMGKGFGGYSALQSSIIFPNRFRCAVSESGFYDLNLIYENGTPIDEVSGKAYFNKVIGSSKKELEKFSPIKNLKNLMTPVFIVHGEMDYIFPIEQAENLIDELDELDKTYEWLELDREGHYYYKEENRLEYYKKLKNFLYKYNPVE